MRTHLKTPTPRFILRTLVHPHCSQAPFQNTPMGRRKYFFYIYIYISLSKKKPLPASGTPAASAAPPAPAWDPAAPTAPGAHPNPGVLPPDFFHLSLFVFFLNLIFLPGCDAPRMSPLQRGAPPKDRSPVFMRQLCGGSVGKTRRGNPQ